MFSHIAIKKSLEIVCKALHTCLSASYHAFNLILHYLELSISPGAKPYHRPLFIVGAPRSGSTLVYQVIKSYFDFGYLSNLHCLFYGAPSLVQKLFNPLRWNTGSSYTSYHGRTQGLIAPSECGEYWYRFFPRHPQHVCLKQLSPRSLRQLRQSVTALVNSFNRSVVFKNLMNSVRLDVLAKVFPEALFIVVGRNEIDNGYSILRARLRATGTYDQWWSLEPPSIESLQQYPAYQQVVEQIRQTYGYILSEMERVDKRRFISIKYEALCHDVYGELTRLEWFFREHGVVCEKRGKVPQNFKIRSFDRNNPKFDRNIVDRMVKYVMETGEDHAWRQIEQKLIPRSDEANIA